MLRKEIDKALKELTYMEKNGIKTFGAALKFMSIRDLIVALGEEHKLSNYAINFKIILTESGKITKVKYE